MIKFYFKEWKGYKVQAIKNVPVAEYALIESILTLDNERHHVRGGEKRKLTNLINRQVEELNKLCEKAPHWYSYANSDWAARASGYNDLYICGLDANTSRVALSNREGRNYKRA